MAWTFRFIDCMIKLKRPYISQSRNTTCQIPRQWGKPVILQVGADSQTFQITAINDDSLVVY